MNEPFETSQKPQELPSRRPDPSGFLGQSKRAKPLNMPQSVDLARCL